MAADIAIVGASGYAGAELVRLLSSHPKARVALLVGDSSAGERFDQLYPAAKGHVDLVMEAFDADRIAKAAQLVFLATPHGQGMKLAPPLLERGLKVIDLSADFRLKDPIVYEKWYKTPHSAPQFLAEAVYGLPELNRKAIAKARLLSNPGCYPTSVILPSLPLLKQGVVAAESLVADSKSGVSGAGRKLAMGSHFCEVADNFLAYKIAGTHQHTPEIEQALSLAAGRELTLTFTPHLLPMVRGILTTLYADLIMEGMNTKRLIKLYQEFYADEPFVRIYGEERLPDLRAVRGSNYCDIAPRVDERSGRVVVVACEDNLGKGAAGQAVQNMNIMMGFEETAGLDRMAFTL
jgi:N-acetyl-gamma-glutamyl-phosphate reductase